MGEKALQKMTKYSSITEEQVRRELARRKALSRLMVDLEASAAAQQIDTTNAESIKENYEKIKKIAVRLALKRDDLAEVDVRRSFFRLPKALQNAAKEQCPVCNGSGTRDSEDSQLYVGSQDACTPCDGTGEARMIGMNQQADQTRRLAGASLPAMSPLSLALLSVGVFVGGFLCFRCFRKRRRAGALPRYNDEKSI